MTRWAELKHAFWTVVDLDPADRASRLASLAARDPELAAQLDALLAADARGETIEPLFHAEAGPSAPERPARIGAYDVLGIVATGGMGEVYRARDPRLHREVAIKVLPGGLTDDPDRRSRLEREARVLASFNHPHIAHVYGLEEAGGSLAIVMELVDGPTLASVIARYADAPLPLARVLEIARQIADGLDAAHEKGIIHRDLKPANVALTQEGDARILDFGVAKSLDGRTAPAAGPPATEAGVVLGTPAYMSPEQARGLAVDRRTDVWAFGCLLYELLTGRQPFAGETATDSLAAVLGRDPDMTMLPAATPVAVRTLLRHCLEKDPKRRLRDIGDARLVLDDVLTQGDGRHVAAADVQPAHQRGRWPSMIAAAVATLAVVALAFSWWASDPAPSRPPARVVASLVLPQGLSLAGPAPEMRAAERFALSPDGRTLAIVASDASNGTRIWIRDLASAVLRPVPETENASFPFWAPDSASIGFVAQEQLKTVRLSDGAAVTVAASAFRSGTWNRDGVILFTPARASPVHAIAAGGGAPRPVTRLDAASGEVQHGEPTFLPDGRHFLYFSIGTSSGGALDPRGIFLGSLDDPDRARLLLKGATQARYASGHLLFVQGGTLMAQPFDTTAMALRGAPFRVVEDVTLSTVGATGATAAFSVSENGVLAYQAALRTDSRIVAVDRAGTQLAVIAAVADYGDVALSPDGTRVAASVRDPARSSRDLWVYDVAGNRKQRVTFDAGDEFAPVWSPDGTRLLYSALNEGLVGLHVKGVGSAGDAQPLHVDGLGLGRFAADWSRDGRFVMYVGGGRAIARSDLWMAPLSDPRDARALLESPFIETHGRFSPSGRWFVYASNESGQLEVYADRFPDRGTRQLISTGGGAWPRWSSDGREVVYLSHDNRLMAVDVRATGDRLDVGIPRALFALRPRPSARLDAYAYDVFPDGRRFLVNALAEDTGATTITLVLDWNASR